jgi:hypothetical protein
MKSIFKSVNNQLILLSKTTVSLLSVLFFSSFFTAFKFQKYYKKNDECLLIGNGYSLKEVLEKNIGLFIGKDVFSVNLFYETAIFSEIKPNNYIIADDAFWKLTSDERLLGIQSSFYKNIAKVTWNMKLFIPNEGYKIILKRLPRNDKIQLLSYNRTPISGYKFISHLLYKLNLGMPRPANVLNAAIFVALNLGYKNIYLYGADHSWMKDLLVDEKNNICCFQNHFYDEKKEIFKIPKGSLSDGLRSIVDAFDSYRQLNIYSEYLKTHIVNKTKGSFIDIFDNEANT